MKHAQFGDRYVLRLYPGEEVVETLTRFAREERIRAGALSGIGAIRDITLGYFDPETREYAREELPGSFEVVNLSGNLALLDGEPMLHLHATVADKYHKARGGHLFSATVSVTLEVILILLPGDLERKWDEETELNLLHFP